MAANLSHVMFLSLVLLNLEHAKLDEQFQI